MNNDIYIAKTKLAAMLNYKF